MHGSDRVPDLKIDYERARVGRAKANGFHESEMALFYECMLQCARKLLDTADIVREAMFQQLEHRPFRIAPLQQKRDADADQNERPHPTDADVIRANAREQENTAADQE